MFPNCFNNLRNLQMEKLKPLKKVYQLLTTKHASRIYVKLNQEKE